MASVRVEGLRKAFGDTEALRGISFEVRDGEFFSLLGPPGAGKTTTLRIIAGLESPDEGRVWLGEEIVDRVHPKDRDVAMVFEDLALYPHWSAFDNIAHPLKLRKVPLGEIEERVRAIAGMLKIDHLLDRRPGTFSGGERRRVAIGRALVRRPRVLLLDQPLSDLDAKIRQEMAGELKRLQAETGQTMIYATHDYEEAVSMADRIMVIHQGQEEQTGAPQALYREPDSSFVAAFIGSPAMNFVPCKVERAGGELVLQHRAFTLSLAGEGLLSLPDEVLLGIRPEHIRIEAARTPGALPAEVDIVQVLGEEQVLDLRLEDGTTLKAIVVGGVELKAGDPLFIRLERERAFLFDQVSGRRILGPGL